MIIVEMSGGLGNQMFQYATARNLCLKKNTPLKLFISKLHLNWHRRYVLKCFNTKEDFISIVELNKIYKTNNFTSVHEPADGFNETIFDSNDNLYLKGYWQSEKYFKQNEEQIRTDFTFRVPPEGKNKEIGELISSTNSVAVHVRRGDYVTISKTQSRYGEICNLDYYNKCINHMSKSVSNPHFFIFSDDPEWTKKNLKLNFPATFVNHNSTKKHFKWENYYLFRNGLILLKYLFPDKAHEDLRLMSHCKHFIIANSTFSWWAAWLGKHSGKIVCAPSRWVNVPQDKMEAANKRYKDLIPESWIKF